MSDLYGKAKSETHAADNEVCRKIAWEISNFGITERQRLLLIYLLGLEIENVEHMRAVTQAVRDLQSDAFLVDKDKDGEVSSG